MNSSMLLRFIFVVVIIIFSSISSNFVSATEIEQQQKIEAIKEYNRLSKIVFSTNKEYIGKENLIVFLKQMYEFMEKELVDYDMTANDIKSIIQLDATPIDEKCSGSNVDRLDKLNRHFGDDKVNIKSFLAQMNEEMKSCVAYKFEKFLKEMEQNERDTVEHFYELLLRGKYNFELHSKLNHGIGSGAEFAAAIYLEEQVVKKRGLKVVAEMSPDYVHTFEGPAQEIICEELCQPLVKKYGYMCYIIDGHDDYKKLLLEEHKRLLSTVSVCKLIRKECKDFDGIFFRKIYKIFKKRTAPSFVSKIKSGFTKKV